MNTVNANDFIQNVKTGDVGIVEFSTRDNEDGTAPEFRKPQTITFYVERRTKAYKSGRRVYPAGEIAVITVDHGGWAEHRQDDWCPDFAVFLTENYRMHVLSWNNKEIDTSLYK